MAPVVERWSRGWQDLQISGRDRLPTTGAYVVAVNHLSFLDPVLVTTAAHRNVRYLAVDQLFRQSRAFERLIGFFGAIPTSRSRFPVSAVREALRHLAAGGVVGVFPEGRRVLYWGEDPPKPGAAWLSMASGAPLIPLAMEGTQRTLSIQQRAFKRAPIRIWVEDPIDPLDFMDCVDPAAAMMEVWRESIDARLGPWWQDRPRPTREGVPDVPG